MKSFTGIRKLGMVAAFSLCAGVALAAMPAWADLKITSHGAMDSPATQNMPAGQQSMMGQFLDSVTYIHGKKFRKNTAIVSIIIDRGSDKMFILNNMSKTYSEMPYNQAMANAMLQAGGGGMAGMPGAQYNVEDTGKTTTLIGHKARHYVVTAQMSLGNMGTISTHADILAAQDLPAADMAAYEALYPNTGSTHVKGVPIQTITTVTGGPTGAMTIKDTATSISTAPVPESVFAIPQDYTKSQSPGMPGMGMPGMAPPPAQ